jgi:hypothetical protein
MHRDTESLWSNTVAGFKEEPRNFFVPSSLTTEDRKG